MKFYAPLTEEDRDFFNHFVESMAELSHYIHRLRYTRWACDHRKHLMLNLQQCFPIIICEADEEYREELKVSAEATYQDGYVFYRESEDFHNIPTRWDNYEQLADLVWKDYSRAVRCPECGYANEVELFFKKIRNRTVHVPGALGVALARFMKDFAKMNPAEHLVLEYHIDKRNYLDYADGFGTYALTKKVLGFTKGKPLTSEPALSHTASRGRLHTPPIWYKDKNLRLILTLILIFEILVFTF
jgi:hypothetical protein